MTKYKVKNTLSGRIRINGPDGNLVEIGAGEEVKFKSGDFQRHPALEINKVKSSTSKKKSSKSKSKKEKGGE